jgi:mRNA interferase HigB
MTVVGRKRLDDFCHTHADMRQHALAWLAEVAAAEWRTPHELRERFPHASLIGNGRVVFNLRGNRYRLDTKISYQNQVAVIVRIGTHAEYDRWEF